MRIAPVAQLVERYLGKVKVEDSSSSRGSFILSNKIDFAYNRYIGKL